MDEDEQLAAKMRSGGTMTTIGILLLVGSFFGACIVAASTAGHGDPTEQGMKTGQSPLLLLAIGAGIALIAVGQARKADARRAIQDRFHADNTTVKVVPDAEAPGGPFRGGMKEVAVLDPVIADMEAAQQAEDRRRGGSYLLIGGLIMGLTVLFLMLVITSASDGRNALAAMGLSMFPFGLGMFFGIKGLLLRSK